MPFCMVKTFVAKTLEASGIILNGPVTNLVERHAIGVAGSIKGNLWPDALIRYTLNTPI